MIFDCANCHKKVDYAVRDKVSNKLVCESCMHQAIELGLRFRFDFE